MHEAEAGYRSRLDISIDKGGDQPVTLKPLYVVDALNECGLFADCGPELEHRFVGEMGLSCRKLPDHPPI
jgi:hypothetical protein